MVSGQLERKLWNLTLNGTLQVPKILSWRCVSVYYPGRMHARTVVATSCAVPGSTAHADEAELDAK